MIVVAGPRIDPASLPQAIGLEYRGYVHNLYEQFAACDLALVQGGLSTTMELVATGRPFLYFPLRNHFEQTFHVPHRLANYGVAPDARVDFTDATPERLAERIVQALGSTPIYRPVESDGAARAARSLAELL
jgi:predicted glycosyltransferase